MRLAREHVRQRIGQQRHRTHDGANRQVAAHAAGNGIELKAQLVDVRLDQAGKTQCAVPGLRRD